jgi:hypothetical protein
MNRYYINTNSEIKVILNNLLDIWSYYASEVKIIFNIK